MLQWIPFLFLIPLVGVIGVVVFLWRKLREYRREGFPATGDTDDSDLISLFSSEGDSSSDTDSSGGDSSSD